MEPGINHTFNLYENQYLKAQISQIPFYKLCKIIASNGGPSFSGIPHLAPWIIKTVFFEPLRWIELVKWTKKISQHEIEQSPIFILGYYRSGTTYLQRMFMQDRSFGYTSIFQSVLPEIMLTFEKKFTPPLQFISRLLRLQNHFHRVPLTWKDFPGEEDVALTALLQKDASQWGSLFPAHFNKYLENNILMTNVPLTEIEGWKRKYLFLLKKISMSNNQKQLVLKNPPNTARLKLLHSLFPEAKFIHIIRDPLEVFASNRKFWSVIKKNYALGTSRSINTDKIILDSYAAIMQKYQEEKKLVPPGQLVEIRYEDFIAQPVQTLHQLYKRLNLGDFESTRQSMIDFVGQQKKYQPLQHNLDEETTQRILAKWDPYIKLWNELGHTKPVY